LGGQVRAHRSSRLDHQTLVLTTIPQRSLFGNCSIPSCLDVYGSMRKDAVFLQHPHLSLEKARAHLTAGSDLP
jgi:hypothetical protein